MLCMLNLMRMRSIEGNPQRDSDFRGDDQKKDEILAQDNTPTLFVVEFVEIGNRNSG
jgi:hypothetical protein